MSFRYLQNMPIYYPNIINNIEVFHPFHFHFSPLSANITKWLNTLKQFVGKLSTNCLSVFDNFVGLVLKGLG